MSPSTHYKGYLRLLLRDDNGRKAQMYVHRLVALAWIPNPDNLATVNHKDEQRDNNHKDNLEWMSNGDNIDYSQSGTYKFLFNGELIEVSNLSKFCRDNNLSQGNMSSVLTGKRKSHKGYRKP